MAPFPSAWLNRNAIDMFITIGSMEPYEQDCHETGEKRLLDVIKHIVDSRKPGPDESRQGCSSSTTTARTTSSVNTASTHDEDRDDFIVDLNELMIKDSFLEISSVTDRKVFEFCMLDNKKNKAPYVGKQFTLVRKRKDENEKDRKRNIKDEYNRVSRELHVWNKLRNLDNFVQLLYISLNDGKSITAVVEKFDLDVRQSFSKSGIDFITIIKGVANGLDFLHKFSDVIPDDGSGSPSELQIKKIAHSDVKCANVFLKKGSSTPYLADFGVSHQVVEGAFTKMIITSGAYAVGTAPWMPPELLILPDNVTKVTYTTESDVWSFGMTIYEIVSSNDPWAQDVTKGLMAQKDVADMIHKNIKEAMNAKDLPKWPSLIPNPLQTYSSDLQTLHKRCCKYVPGDRLTMEEVVEKLDEIFVQ